MGDTGSPKAPKSRRRRRVTAEDVGDLSLPEVAENAPERKRLLNILAQRRYRRRRKEHLQALQTKISELRHHKNLGVSEQQSQFDCTSELASQSASANYSGTPEWQDLLEAPNSSTGVFDPIITPWDPYLFHLKSADVLFSDFSISNGSLGEIIDLNAESSFSQTPPLSIQSQRISDTIFNRIGSEQEGQETCSTLASHLQDHQSSTFTFPDDHLIEVPSLTLLNGVLRVAIQLNFADILWDISSVSRFYVGQERFSTPSPTEIFSSDQDSNSRGTNTHQLSPESHDSPVLDISTIPPHLQPTMTQKLIPHHPLFDLIPWPNARDKLIQVFSMPLSIRPVAARDAMGIMRLVYDMEDPGGEGLAITGRDPFDPQAWEIGQVLFRRWWWAFETRIVEDSNQKRRERGKAILNPNSEIPN